MSADTTIVPRQKFT